MIACKNYKGNELSNDVEIWRDLLRDFVRHILKVIVAMKSAHVSESDFDGLDIQGALVDIASKLVLIDEPILPAFGEVLSTISAFEFNDFFHNLREEFDKKKFSLETIERTISVMITLGLNDQRLLMDLSNENVQVLLICLQELESNQAYEFICRLIALSLKHKENVITFASSDAIAGLLSALSCQVSVNSCQVSSSSVKFVVDSLNCLTQQNEEKKRFVDLGGVSLLIESLHRYCNDEGYVSSALRIFLMIVEEVTGVYDDYVSCIATILSSGALLETSFANCLEILIKLCSLRDDGESYTIVTVRSGIISIVTKRMHCMKRSHFLVLAFTEFINITISYSKAMKYYQDAGGMDMIIDMIFPYRSDPLIRSLGGSIVGYLSDNDILQASVQSINEIYFSGNPLERQDVLQLFTAIALIEILTWEASNISRLIKIGAIEALVEAFKNISYCQMPICCTFEIEQIHLSLNNILSVLVSSPTDSAPNTVPILNYALGILERHNHADVHAIESGTKLLLMLSYDRSISCEDEFRVFQQLALCFIHYEALPKISFTLLSIVLSMIKWETPLLPGIVIFVKCLPLFVKKCWNDIKFYDHFFVIAQICMELDLRASGQVVLIECGMMHIAQYLYMVLNDCNDSNQFQRKYIMLLAKTWERFRGLPNKSFTYCQGTMPSNPTDITECIDTITLDFVNQRCTQKQSEKRIIWLISVLMSTSQSSSVVSKSLEALSFSSIHHHGILMKIFDRRNASKLVSLIQKAPSSSLLNAVSYLAQIKSVALKLVELGLIDILEYTLCMVCLFLIFA